MLVMGYPMSFLSYLKIQILLGLVLTLNNFLKIIKHVRKLDQTKLNNNLTDSELIQE